MPETYQIVVDPVPRPRMTQRDKWRQRPSVVRYRAFCDALRREMHGLALPDAFTVTFYVPMPKSWSGVKKRGMVGKPHQQRPDLDNYLKAFCDALRAEDAAIWNVHARKIWAYSGSITLMIDE